MQINQTRKEIENILEILKDKLNQPPRKKTRRSYFDIARSEVTKISKNFRRKINNTWHSVNGKKGIEAELDAVIEKALLEIAHFLLLKCASIYDAEKR